MFYRFEKLFKCIVAVRGRERERGGGGARGAKLALNAHRWPYGARSTFDPHPLYVPPVSKYTSFTCVKFFNRRNRNRTFRSAPA